METLEAHIPDEKARFTATYAALSIQGMTKTTLVETATVYKNLIEKDKESFDQALAEKVKKEVGERQSKVLELEQKIAENTALIQKLSKEITDNQLTIGKLKNEAFEEENKIRKNGNGYQLASQAIISKIVTDIQKIQSNI